LTAIIFFLKPIPIFEINIRR